MAPIPPSAFERRFAALAPAARARLVAAVYAARGATATATATGDRVEVRVRAGERAPDAGSDRVRDRDRDPDRGSVDGEAGSDGAAVERVRTLAVVGRDDSGDLGTAVDGVVGPAAVRRALLYAVDRETGRRLCRAHLDVRLDGWPADADTDDATGWADGLAGRLARGRAVLTGRLGGVGAGGTPALAVALLLASVLVVAAGVPGVAPAGLAATGGDGDGDGGASLGAGTEPAPAVSADGAAGDDDDGTATATATGVDGGAGTATPTDAGRTVAVDDATASAVPGLTERRVTDPGRLAAAHREALAGESYAWRLVYSEYAGGREVTRRETTLRVANATRYRTATRGWGEVRSVLSPVPARGATYADGAVEFTWTAPGRYTTRPVGEGGAPGRHLGRVTRMIAWYLPARGSSVTPVEARTNGSFLHVESAGGPADLVNNATTRALVSREGMVVRLSHTHVPTRGNRTVVVRFRYLPGPATVDRPTWLDDPDGWTATLDRRDPANRSGTGGTARG